MTEKISISSALFLENFYFQIIKAKSKNKGWINKKTMKEVMECRKAYLIYGKVPLLDEYDKKSTVYLIKVRSKDNGIKENFSIRFVHAKNNIPYATEDFFHLSTKDNKEYLETFLKNRLKFNKDIKDHIATISKFCGKNLYNKNKVKQKLITSREAFCLGNYAYLNDLKESKNIDYITALFRHEVIGKSLLLKSKKHGILPKFTKASKILGWQNPINRTFSAYKYPGYFLNLDILQTHIQTMYKKNHLTKKTLIHYFGKDLTKKILSLNKILPWEGRKLSGMLTENGIIKFSSLTGDKFRKELDIKVKDGPDFYFLQRSNWEKSINTMFNLIFYK